MTTHSLTLPGGPVTATRTVPGDKSLSHRALILGAMANGTSAVRGLGPGEDVRSTARVLAGVGVAVSADSTEITSPGIAGWAAPAADLDCGNSGTTMRLLAGALAGRAFTSRLVGDASLTRRPMRRLVGPLEALGARIATTGDGATPPLTVGPSIGLRGADVTIPLASAQVRSAFQLAALQAEGASTITGPAGYRDHTERWLEALGRGARRGPGAFRVDPGPVEPFAYDVPGDTSSAAYLWAVAALRLGARVTTPGISLNPGRIGFLQVLDTMGAGVEAEVTGSAFGDPVGDVTVTGAALAGTEISGELTVATLDELPLVAVLGVAAEGFTVVSDAAELRGKETDRISATVAMVHALGGGAEPTADGFVVVGTGRLDPGRVEARSDHRIAMAAAVAALLVDGAVTIEGAEAAAVSWPGFYDVLEGLWS